jgi:hypothetical protein
MPKGSTQKNMIKFFSATQQITLHKNEPSKLSQSGPLLYINLSDGLDKSQRLKNLRPYITETSEWFISYGPDALLWQYTAENCFLDQFDFAIPDENHFSTRSFDDEESIDKALHTLLALGSAAHDNQACEHFNIICASCSDAFITQITSYLSDHKFQIEIDSKEHISP